MNYYAIGFPCSKGFAYLNVNFSRVNLAIEMTYSVDVNKATFYDSESTAFKVLGELKKTDAEGILVLLNEHFYDEDYDIDDDDEPVIEKPSVNDLVVIKFSGQKLDAPEF